MSGGDGDLRAAWVRELYLWWRHYAEVFAGGRLRQPLIRLSDGDGTLGSWDRERRVLSISAVLIATASWEEVLATLRHEMAHQFADEVLRSDGEPPHGPKFRQACELLRADPRARAAGDEPSDELCRRNERVLKLLSLGESPNRHEAEAALRKARSLMVDAHLHDRRTASPPAFASRTLGPVRGRHHAWEHTLAALLSGYFFVEPIWVHSYDARSGRRGTVLEVFGRDADLAMAGYVYDYLSRVGESCWVEYRRRAGLRGDRDRLRYLDGLLAGFAAKLAEQDRALCSAGALVPVPDRALAAHVRRRYPHTRTTGGGWAPDAAAYRDGVAAGRRLSLRRPVGESEAGGLLGLPAP